MSLSIKESNTDENKLFNILKPTEVITKLIGNYVNGISFSNLSKSLDYVCKQNRFNKFDGRIKNSKVKKGIDNSQNNKTTKYKSSKNVNNKSFSISH